MKILMNMRRSVWFWSACILIGLGSVAVGADAPALGKEELIQITPDLPKVNGFYHYDFRLTIAQGDRLHVTINSVAGAEIKTQIVVSTVEPKKPKGNRFDFSRVALSQDWTMGKKPPGDALLVRIRANALGQLRLRVDKVSD